MIAFWWIVGRACHFLSRAIFALTARTWRRHIAEAMYATGGHCNGPWTCCQRLDCRVGSALDRWGYVLLHLEGECP